MGNRKKKKTAKRLTSHKCDWKDFPVEIIDAGRAFGSLEARPASGTEGREEHQRGAGPTTTINQPNRGAASGCDRLPRLEGYRGHTGRFTATAAETLGRSIYLLACFIWSTVRQA